MACVSLLTPASATSSLDDGGCYINMTITFSGRIGSATAGLGSPAYTMTVSPATDLDPASTGSQNCFYAFGGLSPWRATTVIATPTLSGDIWTCEQVLGSGDWTQSWNPTPPGAMIGKDYLIAGTWGAWTMFIRDASSNVSDYYAVIELTLRGATTNPSECKQSGVNQLLLTGVEVIQDP